MANILALNDKTPRESLTLVILQHDSKRDYNSGSQTHSYLIFLGANFLGRAPLQIMSASCEYSRTPWAGQGRFVLHDPLQRHMAMYQKPEGLGQRRCDGPRSNALPRANSSARESTEALRYATIAHTWAWGKDIARSSETMQQHLRTRLVLQTLGRTLVDIKKMRHDAIRCDAIVMGGKLLSSRIGPITPLASTGYLTVTIYPFVVVIHLAPDQPWAHGIGYVQTRYMSVCARAAILPRKLITDGRVIVCQVSV